MKIISHILCRSRHLYNCGEGTFRMLYARAHRFRFISNVFCTSNRWERCGGIPSLARAVFDRTSAFPTFHGPPQIERCLRKFAELTDLDPNVAVSDKQFNSIASFEDYYYQVDFVELKRTNGGSAIDETVIAYVCRLRPRKGTVILGKITEDNIPIEYLKPISDGIDIKLNDGTIRYAKDYLSPGFAGASFLGNCALQLCSSIYFDRD